MRKISFLRILPKALYSAFQRVIPRFTPVIVWTMAILHTVLHYFYLYTIIPIDKTADWFDFAVYPLAVSFLFILVWQRSKKNALRWGVPFMTILIVLFVTAFFYYRYYDTVLNISLFWELLHSIDRGAIRHVLGYIGSWIIVAPIGLILVTGMAVYASFHIEQQQKKSWWLPVVVLLLLFVQPVRTMIDVKRPVAMKYKTAKMRIIVNAGLPYYLLYDYFRVHSVEYAIPDEKHLILHENIISLDAPKPYNPKYIFIIQVESLNASIINHRIAGKEVTPFLNQLSRTSYYFPHMFANHLLGSADADFSTLTSLLPQNNQLTYNYSLKHLPSLPRFLHEHGMKTYVFQPLRGSFFNYENAYKQLGVEKYYGRDYFTQKGDGWDVRDSDFFDASFSIIENKIAQGETGLFYLITIQSHGPYRNHSHSLLSNDEMTNIIEKNTDNHSLTETILHYFNTLHETDKALQDMYTTIMAQPWAKDSLLIVFGDHVMEEGAIPLYDSRNGFPASLENVPLFVRIPGIEGRVIPSPVAHIDIAPTVAYLLGHDSNKFWSGQNVFSTQETKQVILNNQHGVFINKDEIVFKNGIIYSFNNKQMIEKSMVNRNQLIDTYLKYSHGWFYGFEETKD